MPLAPLRAVYSPPPPGAEVSVYDGRLTLDGGAPVPGSVWLQLAHDVDMRWRADSSLKDLGALDLGLVDQGGATVSARANRIGLGDAEGTLLGGDIGCSDAIERVVIHWLNLPHFLGHDALQDRNQVWTGRWICEAAGWRIAIDTRPDLTEVLKQASPGDHLVSHIGELRRDDGPFSSDAASDVLAALQMALSFALGRWIAPALPVGLDHDDHVVWQQWAPWRCDYRNGYFHWWDTHRPDDLADMVSAFLSVWFGPEPDSLRHLVHHILSAGQPKVTMEARLMLLQAGMEYWGWVRNVIHGSTTSKDQKAKHADEVIRELLVIASIPTAVPSELAVLSRFAGESGCKDGPEALTRIRNKLIHPKDAAEPYRLEGLLVDAWQLATTYAELLVLHHLGYRGLYLERWPQGRWAHESSPVPWAV